MNAVALRRLRHLLTAACASAILASCGADETGQCDQAECNTPPDAACAGDVRTSYAVAGACGPEGCVYEPISQNCPFGCTEGACNEAPSTGPCDNRVCDAPPPDRCIGAGIFAYDASGVCDEANGSCAYLGAVSPCGDGEVCRETDGVPACVNPGGSSCDDGTRNGDETDVDCGGRCAPCADGQGCATADDCIGGICDDGTCNAPSCTDGSLNGEETDVDCGGPCPACALGRTCIDGADCASEVCVDARCVAVSCIDGTRNGDETDIDCGGSCAPCPSGLACAAASDCSSGVCRDGSCAEASCVDGVLNQGEAGVDCAGPCPVCSPGATCNAATDCDSGVCTEGICAAPSCADDVVNAGETDVDCGGGCSGCPIGGACAVGEDCLSNRCVAERCSDSSCDDGVRNGDESDTDCGGGCDVCRDGDRCALDEECRSGVCRAARCLVPTCTDGVQNGAEPGLDCGAGCAGCPDGNVCSEARDCESGVCTGGFCAVPSCTDGVGNGAETGVDCGGPCPDGCDIGGGCDTRDDCANLACISDFCAPTCDDGAANGLESDVDCGGFCLGCATDAYCIRHSDCASSSCNDAPGAPVACGAVPCAVGTCVDGACRGLCAEPRCDDGIQNGGEIATDCGGPCGRCILECPEDILTWNLDDFVVEAGRSWRHAGAAAALPSAISQYDTPSCAFAPGSVGPEVIYGLELPSTGSYTATTAVTGTGATLDTMLYVLLDQCSLELASELGCNDDATLSDLRSTVTFEGRAGDVVWIVVDSKRPSAAGRSYALELQFDEP